MLNVHNIHQVHTFRDFIARIIVIAQIMAHCIYFTIALSILIAQVRSDDTSGVVLPTLCETCKILAQELDDRFSETGKTNELINTKYSIDSTNEKDVKKYRNSELRFIETLDNICDRILKYNLHKEHKNSKRFAKGQSQTMQTLHNLVNKGVKVELGIPYELWDSPSVEVTTMKQHCETIIEKYEEDIERWYYKNEDNKRPQLIDYLCDNIVLKTKQERSCLYEIDKKRMKGDEL